MSKDAERHIFIWTDAVRFCNDPSRTGPSRHQKNPNIPREQPNKYTSINQDKLAIKLIKKETQFMLLENYKNIHPELRSILQHTKFKA